MRPLYVFFSTGRPLRWRPVTARRLWSRFLNFAIRTITKSELAHVTISDGEAVADQTFDGTGVRFWPFLRYLEHFPGLVCYFRIEAEHDPCLSLTERLPPKRSWDVLLWWLTRGRTRCRTSCVRVATECLRRAGVNAPTVVTPQALHDWLAAQGYHREDLR